jgi:hypothetical protein
MFLNSCFLAYQSHNNYNPLSFRPPSPTSPTSCSFNYELDGCKHAKTCSFAHCLAITTCLAARCAFVVNVRFRYGIPMGVHTNSFGIFCERCFLHFYCCCNPSCIKLGLCTLIGYSLCCNHHLYCFSSFIFLLLPSLCFIVLFCCLVNCFLLQDSQIIQ